MNPVITDASGHRLSLSTYLSAAFDHQHHQPQYLTHSSVILVSNSQ